MATKEKKDYTLTFDAAVDGDAEMYRMLYECFNHAQGTFPDDVARGLVLQRRNSEVLDLLDAMSDEGDGAALPWAGMPSRVLKDGPQALKLSARLHVALRSVVEHGQVMWEPWIQKKRFRPLLAKFDAA